MIIDIGGGTTDIVVHEYGSTLSQNGHHQLKEHAPGTGGLCGGTHIDDNFVDFVEAKIPGFKSQFQDNDYGVYLKLVSEWDSIKRSFKGIESTSYNFNTIVMTMMKMMPLIHSS